MKLIRAISDGSTSHDSQLLEQNLELTFEKIKHSDTFNSAEPYFRLLDQAQFELARMSFKYNFKFSERLKRFIRDFDRLDDESLRKYYYSQIGNNCYTF